MEKLILKWGGFGLLENLSVTQKPITAMLYERMAIHILDGGYIGRGLPAEDRTSAVIFPIIYRIIKGNGRINDIVSLHNEVVEYFRVNESIILEAEANAYNSIDAEAEFTAQFCENYLERGSDPITPTKYIKKWEK